MKRFKIRLAVFLSILMVLPSVIMALPVATTEVLAADACNMYWSGYYGTTEVEQGQKFYIGDSVNVTTYGSKFWTGTASLISASYSSSNASVASVNKKGYFKAIAPGKTKITIRYKGKKVIQSIQVVEAGAFTETEAVLGLRKRADKLKKKIPSKITAKSGYTLYKFAADVKAYADKHLYEVSENGYITEKPEYGNNAYRTAKLAVPQAGRYSTYMAALKNNFGYKNNPTSTRSAKVMQISSASAKPNLITVKLKKKIDITQILAARICNDGLKNEQIKGKGKAYIRLEIINTKKKDKYGIPESYSAVGEIRQGSSVLKIRSFKKYISQKSTYAKVKLKKGSSYRIGSGSNTWSRGKTVTVR